MDGHFEWPILRHVADVGPRWFGVEPEGEIDIWMEGIVGAVINGGEA